MLQYSTNYFQLRTEELQNVVNMDIMDWNQSHMNNVIIVKSQRKILDSHFMNDLESPST